MEDYSDMNPSLHYSAEIGDANRGIEIRVSATMLIAIGSALMAYEFLYLS